MCQRALCGLNDAAPIELCWDAARIDLCRDAAPIDVCKDAAPIDLCRDAAPIETQSRDASNAKQALAANVQPPTPTPGRTAVFCLLNVLRCVTLQCLAGIERRLISSYGRATGVSNCQ